MTIPENLLYLIACLGAALLLLALAFKAMAARTTTISVSPAAGIKFKAEGSHK
jgi:hypothetical protein